MSGRIGTDKDDNLAIDVVAVRRRPSEDQLYMHLTVPFPGIRHVIAAALVH